jgi:hypothetical protein
LADSYLGLAFPLYHGCPNVDEYFDLRSYSTVNIYDLKGSIFNIEKTIEENLFEKNLHVLKAMKERVMFQYNFFALLEQQFPLPASSEKVKMTIYNERHFDTYLDVVQRRFRRWKMRNF